MSDSPNRIANASIPPQVETSETVPTLATETQSRPPSSEDSVHGSEDNPAHILPKIVSFKSLARCGDEIWIENDGQIYRLRRTRQGKLILTK